MQRVIDSLSNGVVVIVGPTAVGKTAVAVELVCDIGGEIVSADSMAIYRGMDVGTAKPTHEEQSRAAFHLIDVVGPEHSFNVGEFQRIACSAIDDIMQRNPPAVIVGGSGLYVRAAIDGLDESVPACDEDIRNKLTEEARIYGNEHVFEMLKRIDPVSAQRIHRNNVKRVIRALEIYHSTGSKPSDLYDDDAKRPSRYPNALFFGLTMDRSALYARIEKRVDAMISAGLVDEVRFILDRVTDPASAAMQGLGYKEMAAYIRGEIGFDEAVDLLKKNTRRFAKRQYTWFRADNRVRWIDVDGKTAVEVSNKIKESLSK
ncbi:MAG: tRNA (adenosine(37)-N6)-dimethylallyltransferase MiaA [Armatimonadetes bacterium]|nr:tRNA (adenosine(37)-N6)-dimethylallyltransferase MiaA [Armatimonadota bacterium]